MAGLREDLPETVSGSELQLDDKLHVPGTPVAEIGIKRIRRAGQPEARTESRRRVGEVGVVPNIEKFSAQAQPALTRDLLRFDKGHVKVIPPRSAESVSSQTAVSPRQRLREGCRIQIWPQRIERQVRITDQIRSDRANLSGPTALHQQGRLYPLTRCIRQSFLWSSDPSLSITIFSARAAAMRRHDIRSAHCA